MKPNPNTKPHFITKKNPKNPRNKLRKRKPGRALKKSPVDCFSEGASRRAGKNSKEPLTLNR
jgi:hypothetical protein